MTIVRSPKEVESLVEWAADRLEPDHSHMPGETYENGIRNAIEWLTREDAVDPRERGTGEYRNRVQ